MADVPPVFADLGKAARDVFNKGFDYPKIKLSLKTKTESGVEFDTNGSHDLDKGRTSGCMKTKLKFPEQGVTFTESWSTGADLNTELTYEPSKVEGLQLSLEGSWSPNNGQRAVTFGTEYKRQYFSFDGNFTLQQVTGPALQGAAVFLYKGWYAGYQAGYEINSAKMTANNISLGYRGNGYTVHSSCTNLADCMASVHHKISDKTEVGLMTTYNVQSSNPGLAVGTKTVLDGGAVVKAKVNQTGQIGLGYSENLRDGVKLSLSSLIEARNISTGGHKLGVSIEFES
ncbi:PREDICTED: voltage-dependent anion-selective channel protein 2-like [Amphimedon queenslandica]|uniref:Voltage-dependent anion-selective channel protein 3 n=1 Tax=Amphimedon queenslandica TaxID=400682 RepID=A0A1X7VE66_AMPQE|nr:PREDICTED: voltage-dependent anion-selective channel protein 2-like [Amphimedon queenslandica]|eukprot:XP_003384452.1 PREDICTED: voltage-dependent anion-selective channel protein 2-like [Amphimedon queenslandica]